MRLPVFCSDIPSHRELADDGAQFFKLAEDPAAIAQENHRDREKGRGHAPAPAKCCAGLAGTASTRNTLSPC